MEALAAVLGGTQSLHTNSFDEALALPTENAVTIALRTQQIIASESGVTSTVDPLGGSYFIEALTNEIEERALWLMDKVEGMGGSVAAIEAGWVQDEIAESAFRIQQAIESGERVIVGVNRYQAEDEERRWTCRRIDEAEVAAQVERVRALRAARDQSAVDAALRDRCGRRPRARGTCSTRCGTRCRRGRRSARSRTRSARCSGRTRRPVSTLRAGRLRFP